MPHKSDVQVYARFRPKILREDSVDPISIYQIQNEEQTVEIQKVRKTSGTEELKQKFTFDQIFAETTSQQQFYEAIAAPMVHEIFEGFNGTIMAYGQTGSGKTFTMMGDKTSPGITPRIIADIFRVAEERKLQCASSLQCSYVEIYLEKIRDLLNPAQENLKIREISKSEGNTSIFIEDCTVCSVSTLNDILKVIKRGEANRTTAATNMNDRSSRSHSVFIITLNQTNIVKQTRKSSKLFLVDLAGSEDITRSGAVGITLEQAKKINKSLSALSLVIQTLTENTQKAPQHIPYRDSKLTRLLTDSLGGNAKTIMILALSPSLDSLPETISTLNFGARTKKMKNCARINEDISYKKLVSVLKAELALWISKYDTLFAAYQNHPVNNHAHLANSNSNHSLPHLANSIPLINHSHPLINHSLPLINHSLPLILSSSDILNSRPHDVQVRIREYIKFSEVIQHETDDINDADVMSTIDDNSERLFMSVDPVISVNQPPEDSILSEHELPNQTIDPDLATTEESIEEKDDALTEDSKPIFDENRVDEKTQYAPRRYRNLSNISNQTLIDLCTLDRADVVQPTKITEPPNAEVLDLLLFRTGNLCVFGTDDIFTFSSF